jgi:HSP20 family protein
MFSRFITTNAPEKNTANTPATTDSMIRKNEPTRTPHITVKDADTEYVVDVIMPGVAPEQAQVSVKDGVLTIRGNLSDTPLSDLTLTHREYAMVNYQYSVALPKDINIGAIQAASKNGILHLALPKVTPAQPQQIAVKALN